jgi:hypothetical protein
VLNVPFDTAHKKNLDRQIAVAGALDFPEVSLTGTQDSASRHSGDLVTRPAVVANPDGFTPAMGP